jgi:hypothetical protein
MLKILRTLHHLCPVGTCLIDGSWLQESELQGFLVPYPQPGHSDCVLEMTIWQCIHLSSVGVIGGMSYAFVAVKICDCLKLRWMYLGISYTSWTHTYTSFWSLKELEAVI